MEREGKLSNVENPEIVISGSFRKHMEQIGRILENFKKADVKVLAPATKEIINPNEEFIILATDDPGKPPHKLEMDFMRKIRKANFLYVADINGYVGQSAATEMTYARLKELPIVLAESIKNFSEATPGEAQEILKDLPATTLAIDEISKEGIERVKKRLENFSYPELIPEQRYILRPLVKNLLEDLSRLKP